MSWKWRLSFAVMLLLWYWNSRLRKRVLLHEMRDSIDVTDLHYQEMTGLLLPTGVKEDCFCNQELHWDTSYYFFIR